LLLCFYNTAANVAAVCANVFFLYQFAAYTSWFTEEIVGLLAMRL